MDRADALRKYQSLRKMTVSRGATEGEADTAQRLADRLAERFGFTSADDTAQVNAFEEIMRRWAAEGAARAARERAYEAARQQAAREAREAAAARKYREQQAEAARKAAGQASGEQAGPDGAWDRQWWYDYQAARRTWHWEMRKCGKASCWCKLADVKAGQGHGPYRYAKKRSGAKVNSVYLGRGR